MQPLSKSFFIQEAILLGYTSFTTTTTKHIIFKSDFKSVTLNIFSDA